MTEKIEHTFESETLEAKARWFQSLSLEERMDVFCAFADLILETNPHIVDEKETDAQPASRRILIVTKTSG